MPNGIYLYALLKAIREHCSERKQYFMNNPDSYGNYTDPCNKCEIYFLCHQFYMFDDNDFPGEPSEWKLI